MNRFDAQPMRRQLAPLQMEARDIEAWLLDREPISSGAWNELGREEYARSFTAARTAGTDIADDLYFGIVDTVSRGGTEQDFAALVTPILKQKGWLGGDDRAIAHRVALIYDMQLRFARSAGRWSRYWETRAAFPYLRAIDVGDERVRHPPKSPHSDHRAWGGIILPIEHPFWRRWWTPLGFRCRCTIVQMTRGQLARYKSGVTSEEELEARELRLGAPIFLPPSAPPAAQIAAMVQPTNAEPMPGRPPVDANVTMQQGFDAWAQIIQTGIADDVANVLARLFGE